MFLCPGAGVAKAHHACSHLLPCGGVCSVRLTRAKPKARPHQLSRRLPPKPKPPPSLLPLRQLPLPSLLPRPHQLSRPVRLRKVSPGCVVRSWERRGVVTVGESLRSREACMIMMIRPYVCVYGQMIQASASSLSGRKVKATARCVQAEVVRPWPGWLLVVAVRVRLLGVAAH